MRWTTGALAVAALGCLVSAAPAAASGEIKDACGPGAIANPSGSIVEPPTPWLDICDSDVAGAPGAGSLRAIRATLRLAGDVTARPGLAQYTFQFSTPHCDANVSVGDLVGGDPAAYVHTSCNRVTVDCPVVEGCQMTTQGVQYSADLPASAAQAAADTVTLTLDPNTVKLPKALLDDLGRGVLDSVGAVTWVSADTKAQGTQVSASDPVDAAYGDKPVPLDERTANPRSSTTRPAAERAASSAM